MKIGILTHYYKSINYGGNLQAYALCRILNREGHDAEQISYDKTGDKLFPEKNSRKGSQIVRLALKRMLRTYKNRKILPELQQRNRAIQQFNQKIPHSDVCYNRKNIAECNQVYNAFIVGSDQVWHPIAVGSAYLLEFASEDKPRIAYAASIAEEKLNDQFLQRYKKSLAEFQAISVREESARDLIQPISDTAVEWVLDPTLLLSRQEWEDICTPIEIAQPYLFCFFLGNDLHMREVAEEYAEKHGLQIVTLPHLSGRFLNCDETFGDRQLYEVSPGMLLSLIRGAAYVFTDSFHASVFSLIFEKEFFVFHRSGHPGMASRIESLTALFESEDHFCDDEGKMTLSYIESVHPICYDRQFPVFEKMKDGSMRFIRDNLRKAKAMQE